MANGKTVLILGAGATIADCLSKPVTKQPPLDRGFFNTTLNEYKRELSPVVDYLETNYGITDLRAPSINSLERVFAVLYTDVFGGDLTKDAYAAFRALVNVFVRKLAATTNGVTMTHRCRLYRLLVKLLDDAGEPQNLTIVTFNQDLQVEKALDRIAKAKHRAHQRLFHFPGCYRMEFARVTAPTGTGGGDIFGESRTHEGVEVLKLHGSMNWYSAHNTRTPSQTALFNPARVINVTRRKQIDTRMTLTAKTRAKYTFPLIVPPVVHKSGILHEKLKPVWSLAESRLREAERLIILGYSCPENDWESANLISRALTANDSCSERAIIDPDPQVLLRYATLGRLRWLDYYAYIDEYLPIIA